mgnify:CR=1 FL=1
MSKKSETKLTKYRLLRASSALAKRLPRTRSFSRHGFYQYARRYRKVIAKPISGSGGAGVILISRTGSDRYLVHRGPHKRKFRGKRESYRYLRSKISRRYLLQRGISLARVGGRPFDVRVMVQRQGGSDWHVTGMLAKVAGRGYIITNVKRSGGYVLPLASALARSNMRGSSPAAVIGRLRQVALAAARRLSAYYTSQRVFGLDMGIDKDGKVWIIEANLRPDISLFSKLKDKSMYRRILSYRR